MPSAVRGSEATCRAARAAPHDCPALGPPRRVMSSSNMSSELPWPWLGLCLRSRLPSALYRGNTLLHCRARASRPYVEVSSLPCSHTCRLSATKFPERPDKRRGAEIGFCKRLVRTKRFKLFLLVCVRRS